MNSPNLQQLFLLVRPEKQSFDLLNEYNNHLILKIDEMKLHSFHKEEVKAVLQQAITELIIDQQNLNPTPKIQHWILRLLQKAAW